MSEADTTHSKDAQRSACKANKPLRVIVLTPGVGGMGGISRLMDDVSQELGDRPELGTTVHFISTTSDRRFLWPLVFAGSLLRVAMACLTGRCDVLHINLASFGSTYRKLLIARFAAFAGTPYVIHLHGGGYREFWATRPNWMKKQISTFFRRAARIILLGAVWRDLIIQISPEASARIVKLPNATRTPAFTGADDLGVQQTRILFLGRLNEAKGVRHLIEALAMLKNVDGWTAVLAGDGEVVGTREAVADAGLTNRVEVPGWLGPDEVSRLWQSGGIFVLPSFVENQPISILEAFAHRVPVVCTAIGSVPEMVEDGRTGIIVPAGDSRQLAAAIGRLIEDEPLRLSLASAARREFDDRYELGGYVRRLLALWREAAWSSIDETSPAPSNSCESSPSAVQRGE